MNSAMCPPYQPYQPAQAVSPGVQRARLCVGFVAEGSAIPISSRQANGAPVTYHDARVASVQQVACSPVMSWR